MLFVELPGHSANGEDNIRRPLAHLAGKFSGLHTTGTRNTHDDKEVGVCGGDGVGVGVRGGGGVFVAYGSCPIFARKIRQNSAVNFLSGKERATFCNIGAHMMKGRPIRKKAVLW